MRQPAFGMPATPHCEPVKVVGSARPSPLLRDQARVADTCNGASWSVSSQLWSVGGVGLENRRIPVVGMVIAVTVSPEQADTQTQIQVSRSVTRQSS